MASIWLRSETRPNESRAPLTPSGAGKLIAEGHALTVESSPHRIFADDDYAAMGATLVEAGSWHDAPVAALILGIKELPEDTTPLVHRHIMFGHAYKGQSAGARLLDRFTAGGGTLYDLEYMTDATGRRVAAFGYWAGHAGAAVTLAAFGAQAGGGKLGPLAPFADVHRMRRWTAAALGDARPEVLVIGALGRVGTGATDLCTEVGLTVTRWDQSETASGGPFPEILDHGILLNCILARPGTPVFVAADAASAPRRLRAIGDIACDPDSPFTPIRVNDRITTWDEPVMRAHGAPPLDIVAIDNLPSLLPLESSEDFAGQLLPWLRRVDRLDEGAWAAARAEFDRATASAGAA